MTVDPVVGRTLVGMEPMDERDVADYYRSVGATLAEHLQGREIRLGGWATDLPDTAVDYRWSADEVDAAVGRGVRWFSWHPGFGDAIEVGAGSGDPVERGPGSGTIDGGSTNSGPACVSVSVGDGANVATAATAALALIEDLRAGGADGIPATDGHGGLLVYRTGIGATTPSELHGLVRRLAERAPEIATLDAASADGRAWLAVPEPGSVVPAPYSLVDSADGTGAVVPLTLDEVAAVTAGMPLDPVPQDAVDRLAVQGDVAGALLK